MTVTEPDESLVYVTSLGDRRKPLRTFTKDQIRPSEATKRTIQCAYLDSLYFQYREQDARRYRVQQFTCLIVCAIVCGAIWMSRNSLITAYLATTLLAAIAALAGYGWYVNQDDVSRFQRHRKSVKQQLMEHGAYISDFELNTSIATSTDWDTPIKGYTKSRLGIVQPVMRNGVPNWAYAYDAFDDEVYRGR